MGGAAASCLPCVRPHPHPSTRVPGNTQPADGSLAQSKEETAAHHHMLGQQRARAIRKRNEAAPVTSSSDAALFAEATDSRQPDLIGA
eukprot:NODE_31850_length_388_cov_2.678161.p2 GENE.NODE_31850_length_388_cov_2.678161~~NODE_31850_length_388_cov_2.678161.p2  ORF type:complete len:88 (+),score=13.97 NODE_31850_length_388_cov_2.678161:111-374(+)